MERFNEICLIVTDTMINEDGRTKEVESWQILQPKISDLEIMAEKSIVNDRTGKESDMIGEYGNIQIDKIINELLSVSYVPNPLA